MTHENRFSSGTPLAATANKDQSLNEPEAQAGNTLLVPQMELRVKVAELCGWTDIKRLAITGNPPKASTKQDLPDYPNDLNACAEFSHILGPKRNCFYYLALVDELGDLGAIDATAEQRCRAFIATMEGKQ